MFITTATRSHLQIADTPNTRTVMSRSHWLKKLGTHLVPSLVEANSIRDKISCAEEDLREVEQEIGVQDTVLNRLSCKRNELSRSIENHKALLSPVRRLPDEILAEIFMHCLLPYGHIVNEGTLRLLTQISSRWRAIALLTQVLWSFIFVGGKSTTQGCLANLTLQLERSGTHPLTVFLMHPESGYPNGVSGDTALASSVLGAILRSSHRCQILYICAPSRTMYQFLPTRDCWPLLHSLHIQLFTTSEGPIFDSFEIAPKLRSVELTSRFYPHQIKLPWSQLTEFIVNTPDHSPAECLEVLRKCSNLISCTFTKLRDKIEPLQTPLRHSQLCTLSIPLESCLGGFFDCLTLHQRNLRFLLCSGTICQCASIFPGHGRPYKCSVKH